MVYGNLSGVINAMKHDGCDHDAVLRVRRILHSARFDDIPLYVVVQDKNMFIVSDYMAAMIFNDKYGLDVCAVWRDSACVWHVVRQ